MKKYLYSFLLLTIFVFPLVAFGVIDAQGPQDFLNSGVSDFNQVEYFFENVIRWIYTIFFIVAVLFILFSAYNFLRGGTNPESAKKAKEQLKYAVIAIAIALVASGVSIVIQRFIQSRGR